MTTNLAVGLLLMLAVVAANLPWISDRLFFVVQPASGIKSPWFRLLEWLVLYFIVGGIAYGVEHKAFGGIHQQDWEFYAVNFCLFAIFALPGFIYNVDLKPGIDRRKLKSR